MQTIWEGYVSPEEGKLTIEILRKFFSSCTKYFIFSCKQWWRKRWKEKEGRILHDSVSFAQTVTQQSDDQLEVKK